MTGNQAYLQFSDSPWAQGNAEFAYFHLEDFEDAFLNLPGVTSSAGAVFGPSNWTDSVDADDLTVDGLGRSGHSFYVEGGDVTFAFDNLVLGGYPTHVGLVWTDGFATANVGFEAWDANGQYIGLLSAMFGDDGYEGTTDEDRFIGLHSEGGISAIRVASDLYGFELDHLQVGMATPAPATLAALAGLGLLGRRRRRQA